VNLIPLAFRRVFTKSEKVKNYSYRIEMTYGFLLSSINRERKYYFQTSISLEAGIMYWTYSNKEHKSA